MHRRLSSWLSGGFLSGSVGGLTTGFGKGLAGRSRSWSESRLAAGLV